MGTPTAPSSIWNLTEIFSQPMFRERKERVSETDANKLLAECGENHTIMTYEQSISILNDLAFMIVPFNK